MEDLFQIIFIVIFILSAIVSSMKKKKKQREKSTTLAKNPSQSKASQVSNKKQKSSAELLEEMLGLKIQLPEPPQKEAPTIYSEANDESTWDPTKDFEVREKVQPSSYRDKASAKKSEFNEDKKKHRAFKDEVIQPKMVRKPTKAQKLFRTQSSLKDYIIVQEILNKPKALRR